jgi:hypothetical protein
VKWAFVAAIRDSKGKGKEVDGGDSLMDDDEPSLIESDVPPHLRQSLSSDLVAVWKFIRDEQGQVSSMARLDDDTTLEEAGCVEAEVLGVSFESADGEMSSYLLAPASNAEYRLLLFFRRVP